MNQKTVPGGGSRPKRSSRPHKTNTTLKLLATATSQGQNKLNTFSVIGDDDRWQVGQLGIYPFRTIMRLASVINGEVNSGTAFLVGPSTLLTAGHCLHKNGSLASQLEVYTASGIRLVAETWNTLNKWKQTGEHSSDLGFIRLNKTPSGSLGHFGTQRLAESEAGDNFAIAGYPTDRGNGSLLYCHVCPGVIFDDAYLRHAIDTGGGQSGSPLFLMRNKRAYAVGVHIRGDDTGQNNNRALRLTDPLIDQVKQWLK
ncbi:trypsin-like peptidase domain-containing protein [Lysobacter sp. Root690]|uniref:trypsin-like serine peptidase n=1 Tax=Lysobacter sp. Root690 TaxID=1736588 RepID=UPI0006FBDB39|nr:trypsin-like peptidase domain-containing protein [Lysobacter sp. Root690]KRB08791.1 hypothetical protein ASD86_05710 [Lysobacter sp. Root690]